MEERRQFKRHEVSIPCSVYWHGDIIAGLIVNLSFGGALITQLSGVPPKHALVVLTFQAEKGQVQLSGKLTSRVIHTMKESLEQGQAGSIGVQFQDPTEEVRFQLVPVLRALGSAEDS